MKEGMLDLDLHLSTPLLDHLFWFTLALPLPDNTATPLFATILVYAWWNLYIPSRGGLSTLLS